MADVEVADTPVVSFRKRGAKSKANIRKREATPPTAADSDSGFTSSEDEGGRKIKRRRKNATTVAASSNTAAPRRPTEDPTSTTSATKILTARDEATKTEDWYEATSNKNNKTSNPSTTTTTTSDGTYKGAKNYTTFITRNPDHKPPKHASTAPLTNTSAVGPQRSSNVRTITVTDFAPDVCKDYKQTGFCGFGDSCKFLHAREDYAQGWQLDREWEINTKGKKPQGGKTMASANRNGGGADGEGNTEEDDKLLESIPFACILCKGPYKSPVVTKCGHYFCEACALKRYRKDPSCAACGTGTGGVFNVAKKLERLLERKKERAREKGEENDEGGGK